MNEPMVSVGDTLLEAIVSKAQDEVKTVILDQFARGNFDRNSQDEIPAALEPVLSAVAHVVREARGVHE